MASNPARHAARSSLGLGTPARTGARTAARAKVEKM